MLLARARLIRALGGYRLQILMSRSKQIKIISNLLVTVIYCLATFACAEREPSLSNGQQQTASQTNQSPEQLPIPRGPFKHGFKVETKYDRFRDQTKVSLDCKVYHKGPFGLFLGVEGVYPKQSPSPPETVQFGLTALTAMTDKEKYKKSRHLIVLSDGQRFDLGELDRDVDDAEEILRFEKMMTGVPFRTVLQIANSQNVEMQLNEIEFKVPLEALEALRDFTSRFRQGE